jgi:hypothetical protein
MERAGNAIRRVHEQRCGGAELRRASPPRLPTFLCQLYITSSARRVGPTNMCAHLMKKIITLARS